MNEELSAEEWKGRYEGEKNKNACLQVLNEKFQNELTRWRGGEIVSREEQVKLTDVHTPVTSKQIPIAEKSRLEAEIKTLQQQLEEKDKKLNQQTETLEMFKEKETLWEKQQKQSKHDFEELGKEMQKITQKNHDCKIQMARALFTAEQLGAKLNLKNQELDQRNLEKKTLHDQLKTKDEYLDHLEQSVFDICANVTDLRTEIDTKQNTITQLMAKSKEVCQGHKAIVDSYEMLLAKEKKKCDNLLKLSNALKRQRRELQNMVKENLETLNNLSHGLVEEPVTEKVAAKEEDTKSKSVSSASVSSVIKKQLVQHAEVHKQLVQDNTELLSELPRKDKRLKSSYQKIKVLEKQLSEAKEKTIKERQSRLEERIQGIPFYPCPIGYF